MGLGTRGTTGEKGPHRRQACDPFLPPRKGLPVVASRTTMPTHGLSDDDREQLTRLVDMHRDNARSTSTPHAYQHAPQMQARVLRAAFDASQPFKAKYLDHGLDLSHTEIGKILALLERDGCVERGGKWTDAHLWTVVEDAK